MMIRDECLEILHRNRPEGAVVVTTMAVVAPWSRRSNTSLDFPSAASAMGHAADFALGVALARPGRPVWMLNGDGSMLMSLGTLATISEAQPENLVLFVFQNDTFEVTGNQPIPGAGKISFADMARGAGFAEVHQFTETSLLAQQLPGIIACCGPTFINLRVQREAEPPPTLDCSLRVPALELREALRAAGNEIGT